MIINRQAIECLKKLNNTADFDVFREILIVFESTTPIEVHKILSLYGRGNLDRMTRALQELYLTCHNIGAIGLANHCSQILSHTENKDFKKADQLLLSTESLLEQTLLALKSYS